eukprot:GHUV01035011.1.p2 GENE.GHUV01035011.1~~GHUV01035011.1.p2  ORF type:complete len:100 (-),score=18.30 GHUV01035011.1:400-699(-)
MAEGTGCCIIAIALWPSLGSAVVGRQRSAPAAQPALYWLLDVCYHASAEPVPSCSTSCFTSILLLGILDCFQCCTTNCTLLKLLLPGFSLAIHMTNTAA